MTCPCRPWKEIVTVVESDVVAMGLPAEMGESSLMQLLGKGCIFQCPEHKGYIVAEKSTLMHKADTFRQQAVKCPLCNEAGCDLCEGSGYVTYQQLILEEARRHPGDVWNDCFSPVKSMARWAELRRHFRGKIIGASGHPVQPNEMSVSNSTNNLLPALVCLVDADGVIQVEFRGVSWGYQGSGSRALAIILSDALPERFESYDAALAFTQTTPQDEGWTI